MTDSLDAGLQQILQQAKDAIIATDQVPVLEELRVRYLGKKGELTSQLKQIGSLPASERPKFGDKVNQIKQELAQLLANKRAELDAAALAQALAAEKIDLTLPGRGKASGGLHPVTRTMQRIEDILLPWASQLLPGLKWKTISIILRRLIFHLSIRLERCTIRFI